MKRILQTTFLALVAAIILIFSAQTAPVIAQQLLRIAGTNSLGDPQPLGTTGDSLRAVSDNGNRFHCVVAVSTATTVQAVGGSCIAPGAGQSLYITDVMFSASASGIAADAFPTLKSGTGGTCGTATAVVWQALTAAAIVAVDNRTMPIKVTANNELCWITTTAGSKAIQITGFIAP